MLALGGITAALEGFALLFFIPLVVALAGASPASGGLERRFADAFALVSAEQAVWLSVLLLCLLVIMKNVAAFAGLWLTRRTEGEVAHRLRLQIFEQIVSSCIDYRAGVRRAELVTTLAEHSWKVAKVLVLAYRMVIAVATVLIFVSLLALISLRLLLITLVFLAVASVLVRAATRGAAAIGEQVVRENKAFGQHIWESIQALQLIRTFSRENVEAERLALRSDTIRRRLLRLDLLWGTPAPLTESGILILIGCLILAASWAGVGMGSLAAFLTLLYRLQLPARELMEGRVAVEGAAGAVADVQELLDATRQPLLVDGSLPAPQLRDGIALNDVTFRYHPETAPVLRGVSLLLPARRTTAIIGPSGAGKSTLISLLCRFYDPDSGQITVDGVPLTKLRLESWRGALSLMPQEVQLFNDTVRANIAYSRPQASDEEVWAAARVAHAVEFIARLPSGLDTIIGDRGLSLSGGQRQRLALARTILRRTDILFLDEPTNALDPELEQAFQDALSIFSKERTLVVIAHSLRTVMRADQVIMLEHGSVVDVGTPAELRARHRLRFGLGVDIQSHEEAME